MTNVDKPFQKWMGSGPMWIIDRHMFPYFSINSVKEVSQVVHLLAQSHYKLHNFTETMCLYGVAVGCTMLYYRSSWMPLALAFTHLGKIR